MITIEVSVNRGFINFSFECPECGEEQPVSNYVVCKACMAPIPALDGIVNNTNDRVSFYNKIDPWNY